jgi:hypothetical protein
MPKHDPNTGHFLPKNKRSAALRTAASSIGRVFRGNPGRKPSAKDAAKAEAIDSLRGLIQRNDVIYTVRLARSSSGMRKVLGVYAFHGRRGESKLWLSYMAADATGYAFDEKLGDVVVKGLGHDAGDSLVQALALALFGDAHALRHAWI